MSLKNINKESGFTIVELLIVIVVIGILAAITIVAYNGVQNNAKSKQFQADAANLDKKAESYAAVSTSGAYALTAAGADAATVVAQTTAGANLTTALNAVTESKLPAGIAVFAVVPYATVPTYAQALVAANASTSTNYYFVTYCATGKGMRIYYPDMVSSTAKTLDVGVCP